MILSDILDSIPTSSSFIYRSTNFYAHNTAKWIISRYFSRSILVSTPLCLPFRLERLSSLQKCQLLPHNMIRWAIFRKHSHFFLLCTYLAERTVEKIPSFLAFLCNLPILKLHNYCPLQEFNPNLSLG